MNEAAAWVETQFALFLAGLPKVAQPRDDDERLRMRTAFGIGALRATEFIDDRLKGERTI